MAVIPFPRAVVRTSAGLKSVPGMRSGTGVSAEGTQHVRHNCLAELSHTVHILWVQAGQQPPGVP
eukprot:9620020-Karenia_brevis.AAC.1